MNRILVLYCFVVLCAVPKIVAAEDQSPWEKKLPFKSAIIEYAISGMEEGRETVYIDDYGSKRATYHETVSKMMGMTMTNSTIELVTPDFIYSYDLQSRDGVKTNNPQKYLINEYRKLSAADKQKVRQNAEKMAASYAGAMGVEGMTTEIQHNAAEILGYSCDKVEVPGGSSYLMHDTDILMKLEMEMMGMKMSTVATSFDKQNVDGKYFQHPAGITAEADAEADAMAEEMAAQTVAMLKDPEHAPQPEMQGMGYPGNMEDLSDEDKEMLQQAEKMMREMQGGQGQ